MSWLYEGPYRFGRRSRGNLDTCHPILIEIATDAIKVADFSVIEGHRSQERQQELYAANATTLDGVTKKSKHQSRPSMAMDILPYVPDIDDVWERRDLFVLLAGVIFSSAHRIGAKVRWGGDWNRDGYTWNQKFHDLPHFELID